MKRKAADMVWKKAGRAKRRMKNKAVNKSMKMVIVGT